MGVGALRCRMSRKGRAWSAGGVAATLVALWLGGQAALAQSYAPNTSNRVIVDYGAIDATPAMAPVQQPAYGAAPAYGMPAPVYTPPAYAGYANYYAMQQPYGSGYGMQPYFASTGYAMPLGPLLAPPLRSPQSVLLVAPPMGETMAMAPLLTPPGTSTASRPVKPAAQTAAKPAEPLTPPPPPTEISPPPPAVPTPPPAASDNLAPGTMFQPAPAEQPNPAPAKPAAEATPPAAPAPPAEAPAAPAPPAEATPPPAPAQPAEATPPPAPPAATPAQPAAPAQPAEATPPAPPAPAAAAPAPAPAAPAQPAEAPAAPPAAASTQTASLPPASAPVAGEVRLVFGDGSAEIPDQSKPALDALAQQLAGDEAMRIQLLAYASGTSDTASRSRRLSLSRALAVRSYLIAKGIRSTRMDVRALGNNVEGSPADRVDIIPQKS